MNLETRFKTELNIIQAHRAKHGPAESRAYCERSLKAMRNVTRIRKPFKHYCHDPRFRAAFIASMLARRFCLQRLFRAAS